MLAAAHETGVVTALKQDLPTGEQAPTRLAHTTSAAGRQSLLTLLFLGAVGLRRCWDLRGYTGDALALLTGRRRAYGYFHCERFLAQVVRGGGDELLTDALAAWTATLWPVQPQEPGHPLPAFYLDGHKKPVYTDRLIPRGLIGRTGKILGCRALLLLHDAQGHPLFATTHRGDLHLTKGVPAFLERYEQATGSTTLARLIIDREGMAAEFLATLVSQGRTVVTILRSTQYQGIESFTEVGAFVPLYWDRRGEVTREVASAKFALPLPDHPGQQLCLAVALIRLSLGLDTNHGYAKFPVENSEAARSRAVLERKLAKAQGQARQAREQHERASARSRQLEQRLKRERAEASRALAEHLQAWERQGMWPFLLREKREAFQQEVAARLAPLQQRKRNAEDAIGAAFAAEAAGLPARARPAPEGGRSGSERTSHV